MSLVQICTDAKAYSGTLKVSKVTPLFGVVQQRSYRFLLFISQKQNQSLQYFVIFTVLLMSLGRFCLDTKSQRYILDAKTTPLFGGCPLQMFILKQFIYWMKVFPEYDFPQIVFTFFYL